jgi:hypothetical protein
MVFLSDSSEKLLGQQILEKRHKAWLLKKASKSYTGITSSYREI